MSDKARLAFIGCGGHSSRTLQPNAHAAENVDVVAMCDLDEAKAQAAAARWGVNASYTDYNKMLDEEQFDGVVVVGPPMMMQPITKDLLGRGVSVLTEKPPAVTAALAKELVDASSATGAVGMMATHWRHAPPYSRARAIMAKDEFGEPSHCYGWFYAPGPAAPIWGSDDGLGGYLLAQGVHLVDCTRSLMGDVASVSATSRGDAAKFDACSVSLRFTSGATGALSLVAHAPYWTGHRVFGNAGAFVEVENAFRLKCAVPPFWTGEPRVDYENHSFQTWSYGPYSPGVGGLGYIQEISHFAECVLAGKQPVASVEDGYQAMRVLEAIHESARGGSVVAL